MSLFGRVAARRDENEPEIVRLLELVGARVWRLTKPFDLLVGFRGRLWLLEVKTDKGGLTEEQQRDYDLCTADGLPIAIVRTAGEALRVIGAVRG